MMVSFDSLDNYLAEMRESHPLSTVRAEVCREKVNDGVTEVRVESTYYDDTCFFKATVDCGEDWAGGVGEGSKEAEAVVAKIKAACGEMGVKFGAGKCQLQ